MEYPKRKFPAHHPPVERHNEPVVLFVTACVRENTINLTTRATHEAVRKCWAQADAWRVGAYMIMPDHVHLFCVPGVFPPVPIKKWAQYWKAMFRREMQLNESVWLRDVWDTQVRGYSHYVEKREYVRRNPVRKGLVASHEEWPFQGELNVIRW